MKERKKTSGQAASRRDFLKQSGATLTGAALASAISARSYAGEDNTIQIALIGCGGRGTGAAMNALSTSGPTKLVAMADVFDFRLQASYKNLSDRFKDKVDVPSDRQFLGLDAYRKAIDCLDNGGVALLTTPPTFRPIHLEYAVEKGRNVFMEKSFAVDAPGIRRVMRAGEEGTKKNLKIAGGLMSRHYKPLEEAVARIHDGIIGEVITAWAYREHGPVGFKPRQEGMTEVAHQIHNYSCFTWVNGSFLLDWLIHNLDVCCWVKDAWPVAAQGQGGRQCRTEPDQLFDHYAVEYHFPDGTRLFAQGRHMANCWGFFGDIIHGAKGSAVLGEGISDPKIYNSFQQVSQNQIWNYQGPACNAYQVEHDLLFDAIRNDKPYNEADRCAKAAMTGILGRMAAESGKLISWEDALASDLELAPDLDHLAWDGPAPVMPNEEGKYPIAMPGFTKVI
ncbi:MAG: twin-arginine translocation signal domain-containing protein [Planctomycetes bacterium]|nr:twin-arginine translocation signal domain-containing protein [Planctomycetota bacterium]